MIEPSMSAMEQTPWRTLATAGLPARVQSALQTVQAICGAHFDLWLEPTLQALEHGHGTPEGEDGNPLTAQSTAWRLRMDWPHLRNDCLRRIEHGLAGLRQQPRRARSPWEPEQALALVDDEELDTERVLEDYSRRTVGRARMALFLAGQRFAVLAGRPAFDAEHVPVGPSTLSRALLDAGRTHGIDAQQLSLMLVAFESMLLEHYPGFIDKVNDALVADGILPALTYAPLRARKGAPVDRRTTGAQGGAAAPATGSDASPAAGRAIGRAPDGGVTMSFESLQALLALRRDSRGDHADEGGSPAGAVALPTETLLGTLAAIRDSISRMPAEGQNLASIRREVLASHRQRDGQPAALSRKDSDTFDLLEMLYARVERDISTGTLAAALIKRLQLPLLHAALVDQGFFQRSEHPARQLFGTVAESGARWYDTGDVDRAAQAALQRAVDHVANHAHTDPGAFEHSNRTLQEALQQQTKRAELAERRHVEAARGRERLEQARRKANETIAILTGDREPPRFVRMLLDRAWADAMTLTLLRHGEASAEWTKIVEITRQILAANQDQADAAGPELTDTVQASLLKVGFHVEEAPALSRKLTAAEPHAEDASQTELLARLKQRAALGSDSTGAADDEQPAAPPRNPHEQAQFQLLTRLPYGTVIEFDADGLQPLRRQRIAWYSPVTGNALFVNKRGQKVGESSLDGVARQIAAGSARIVTPEQASVVERAWQSTLSALRSLSGRSDTTRRSTP